MKYENASKGLMMVFIGEIIVLVSSVIGMLTDNLATVLRIADIVALAIALTGLSMAGKDDRDYRSAYILNIVEIVVLLVGTILLGIVLAAAVGNSSSGLLLGVLIGTLLLSVAAPVFKLLILYRVCMTTARLAASLAGICRAVWLINLICTLVALVAGVLSAIGVFVSTALVAAAGALAIIAAIASIVGSVLYLYFLYKGSRELAA